MRQRQEMLSVKIAYFDRIVHQRQYDIFKIISTFCFATDVVHVYSCGTLSDLLKSSIRLKENVKNVKLTSNEPKPGSLFLKQSQSALKDYFNDSPRAFGNLQKNKKSF